MGGVGQRTVQRYKIALGEYPLKRKVCAYVGYLGVWFVVVGDTFHAKAVTYFDHRLAYLARADYACGLAVECVAYQTAE